MNSILYHDLQEYFPEFIQCNSLEELTRLALYQELKPKIEAILQGYEQASFAPAQPAKAQYRAVAWNIERGRHYEGVRTILAEQPELAHADVYLLTESDLGMARSGNRNVARELAEELGLNYFFVPSYLNLEKGSGHEAEIDGDNTLGIHGNAILSRYPMSNFRSVPLPNGKDKMRGKEKRIGSQRVLLADVHIGDKILTVSCIHLDAHSSQLHRLKQMRCVLDALQNVPADRPVLIGGDWNTTTYNSSRALHTIIGFWIRVFMGVDNMIRNHYPHPDRFWEKELFAELTRAGFDYKNPNLSGAGTLIYDIHDIEQEKNLKDWVPEWCFRFIEWSLRNHNGRLQCKLDWFAARQLQTFNPLVINELKVHGKRASDHAAITTDFKLFD